MQDLDHKHMLVYAAMANPVRDAAALEQWFIRLVDAVDMKVLITPQAIRCDTQGNEGVTGIVCIETSHASAHFWETAKVPFCQFDIYSCKRFDPSKVLDLFNEFDPYFYNWTLIDRNGAPQVVDSQRVQVKSIIELLSDNERRLYAEAKRETVVKTTEHRAACAKYNSLSRLYSHKTVARSRKYVSNHSRTLQSIKGRCAQKGLAFDLDQAWYADALEQAKSKWPRIVPHCTEDSFWRADVDRVDSTQGYTKANCRIIPHALNVAKWKWTNSEIHVLLEILRNEIEG
jgi:S-adenosylmethionine/arginine decarboxylase-like enzyme